MREHYDFSGYATKNDVKCSDGRTIRKNAFVDNDGQTVPLVWQHVHDDPFNVLGHALLENRDDGVYAYCKFNETDSGKNAKLLVEHGDVKALSIYANQLKQKGGDVTHGAIREVSLVLAGANPKAYIERLDLEHSEEDTPFDDGEAVMYFDSDLELAHSEEPPEEKKSEEGDKEVAEEKKGGKTVEDVFNSLTEEQKTVVYALIGMAVKDAKEEGSEKKEESEMKHNVFEGKDEAMTGDTLSHAEMDTIFADAKRHGSLKDSVLEHSAEYGIDQIGYLFPDAENVNKTPDFIKRKDEWVGTVMNGVHHTPFSRVKSMHADITADEARAKGYTKGNKKLEEVITLLKRTTEPTTIYKKQKLDRDDILDITDFDVVAWLKTEMRMMLDEEIARAILIGDGRSGAAEDKIAEDHIRPIWTDDTLYSINKTMTFDTKATGSEKAKQLIDAIIRSRKDYRGSGNPVLYTTEDWVTEMLLVEDGIGHKLYKTEGELATALRVSRIVTVPVMEGATREVSGQKRELLGLVVNLTDYNVGADKGGSVNMFDDFDIDYNQQKYLMETRCSGALTKPFSAIVLEATV